MSRYNEIIDGASIVDSMTSGGYTYYGYIRAEGSWIVLRENTAGDEFRYAVGGSDFATAWADPTVLDYARPDEYNY